MKDILVTENPNRLKGEISFEERMSQITEEEEYQEKQRKIKKNSPFSEFAQLNMEGTINEELMYQLSDSPPANKIFWFIANHMDGYNALIASYDVFQQALGISTATVTRGIRKLKELGLLHIAKSGSANVYMLNPEIIWKSWGNNREYCEFPAKIMLARSEQTNDFEHSIKSKFGKIAQTN